jgi:YVTN family beta-propeller protein
MIKNLMFLILVSVFANAQAQPLLLVLNKGENTLQVIDPETMKEIKRVATGEGPHEIGVDTERQVAYVANYGHQQPGNSLSIFSLATFKETRLDLGALKRPHGLVYKSGKVFGTAEFSRTVFLYDVVSGKVDWIQGTGKSISHMLAISTNGKRVFTTDILSNSVTVIDVDMPPLPQYIVSVAVDTKPEAIALSHDDSELWVGHNDSGIIAVIDTKTLTIQRKLEGFKVPIRIHFTPDGSGVLVSDPGASELVLLDAKTKSVKHKLAMPGVPVGITIEEAGKYAYIALTQANKIVKVNLETMKEEGQCSTGQNPDGIVWVLTKT